MSPGLHPGIPRPHMGLRRLLLLVAVAGATVLSAQDSPVNEARHPQAGTTANPSPSGKELPGSGAAARGPGTGFRAGSFGVVAPNPGAAGGANSPATAWNQSLFDAFQPGGRSGRFPGTGEQAGMFDPRTPITGELRPGAGFAGSGPHSPPRAVLPSLNQLNRQGLDFRLNSSAGTFRLSYREFAGVRGNPLGGAVGQGAAAATFTTSNFGSTLMNFSASTYMGGPGTGYITGGIPNSNLWTAGAQKHPGPAVSLRLTF